MLARSVRNPLIIGVGAGAVLVIGTAPAALAVIASEPSPSDTPSATPDPSPSTTPPTPPPPANPTLALAFTRFPKSVQQGTTASMYIEVTPHIAKGGKAPAGVTVHAGSSRATVTFDGAHTFKTLANARLVLIKVSVPSSVSSGKVVVWAQADADNARLANASPSLSLPVKKKPKSHSSDSGSGGGGGSDTPSTPSTDGLTPTGSAPTGTPPQTAASLPDLTQQQTPTTAPVQNSSNSQSMRGTGDQADELTFDKLASTQAAWLAALLVAFSLLLTQVRLGKATAKGPKSKGTHRRPRRTHRAH